MSTHNNEKDTKALEIIKNEKVITKIRLATLLQCSEKTAQRRLKKWNAYTSYNKNSQFYTLPIIPQFDESGLWKFKGIFFSKYGNLKNTVEAIIERSTAGLSAFELTEILGLPVHTFLSNFKNTINIRIEKYEKLNIYFSGNNDIYAKQSIKRYQIVQSSLNLPSDLDAIFILAELINHPDDSMEQLAQRIHRKNVSIDEISNLLNYHGLIEKNVGFLAIRCLKFHQERVTKNIESKKLFPNIPILKFVHNNTICSCGNKLKVLKTREKMVSTLEIGDFQAHETILYCEQCQCTYPCDELQKLVPTGCKFGFDVLVHVGNSIFLQCRNEKEIKAELSTKNINISNREIGYLSKRFIIYLMLAHKEIKPQIKEFLQAGGGYILHIDGTCEGDSPHLITALDEITGIVLGNVKLPSENTDMLIPFFRKLQQDYGDPIASVHDMGKGIMAAINEVFPLVKNFVCHFHFLRDIGKDLLEHEHSLIRNALKNSKIRSKLREKRQKLKSVIEDDSKLVLCLNDYIDGNFSFLTSTIATYTLILWILDSSSELSGYGFPFDQTHLVFYTRVEKAYATVQKIKNITTDNQTISQLQKILATVVDDENLKNTVQKMREKVAVFEQLRCAMRIAIPAKKQGLKDLGDNISIKSVKTKVTAFRNSSEFSIQVSKDKAYQNMQKQIDKYWAKLFADPITVTTKIGETIKIQPQRTNNILEQFFRAIKYMYRKKSGRNKLTKTLKAMIADTTLVKNLENPQYMEILLKDKNNLVELFAEIDVQLVRMELKENQSEQVMPLHLKKALRKPNFPTQLVELIETQSN